jgi:peptidoglycan/LPS O-acetylase OafA/YrhL
MAYPEPRHILIGVIGALGSLVLASYLVVKNRYKAVRTQSEQERVDAVLFRGFKAKGEPLYNVWLVVTPITACSFLAAAVLLVALDNVLALAVMAAFTASALMWSWAICNEIAAPRPPAPRYMVDNDTAGYASAADSPVQDAKLADWPQVAVIVTAILSVGMLLAAAVGPHGNDNEAYYEWSCVLLTFVAFHHVVIDGFLWSDTTEYSDE